MATLSQMCILPDGWGAPTRSDEIRMAKKLAWKTAKRVEHERMLSYRERERVRAIRHGVLVRSIDSDRRRVRRETMEEPLAIESCNTMFAAGKGSRQQKNVRNSVSREQAGTIGRTIVVKRFAGSHMTCVCKSRL